MKRAIIFIFLLFPIISFSRAITLNHRDNAELKHQLFTLKPRFQSATKLGGTPAQAYLLNVLEYRPTTLILSSASLENNSTELDILVIQSNSLSLEAGVVSIQLFEINNLLCNAHSICGKYDRADKLFSRNPDTDQLILDKDIQKVMAQILAQKNLSSIDTCGWGDSKQIYSSGLCFSYTNEQTQKRIELRAFEQTSLIVEETLSISIGEQDEFTRPTISNQYYEFPYKNTFIASGELK